MDNKNKENIKKPEVCSIDKEKVNLSDLPGEQRPEACSIDANAKAPIDLSDLPGEQRPEACSIDANAKAPIDLSDLPGEQRPEACSINKEAKAPIDLSNLSVDLSSLPGLRQPEACGIDKNAKAPIDLSDLPGEQHPEACSIDANAKAPINLSNLPGEQHPEACSIDKEPFNLSNLPGEKYPSVCSIDKKVRQPHLPGVDKVDTTHQINILDTYGYNVPVTKEERQEILAELEKNAEERPKEPNGFTDLKKPLITIIKNGPYIVRGGIPIQNAEIKTNAEGESVGWKDIIDLKHQKPIVLCRCGASKNMPFCDEMHLKIHFDGTCTASNKPYDEAANIYRGCQGVYLMDEVSLCAIVRFCDPDGSCWNLVKDSHTLEKALEETYNCASGRLTIIKDGKKQEPDYEPEIECIYDTERDVLGPLWVKGGIPVKSPETDYEVRNRVTLCRCGRSYNKPFCDGMHLTCKKLTPEEVKEDDL